MLFNATDYFDDFGCFGAKVSPFFCNLLKMNLDSLFRTPKESETMKLN